MKKRFRARPILDLNEVDIAGPFVASEQRAAVAEFTNCLEFSKLGIITGIVSSDRNMFLYAKVFTWKVWLSLLMAIIGVALVAALIYNVSVNGWKHNQISLLSRYFWVFWSFLIGHAISNRLQKEDRDSLLCRLDKVFKSNGIVNRIHIRRDILRHGPWASASKGASSRSGLGLNKIMIRIVLLIKYKFSDIFSEKLGLSNYLPTGNSGKIELLCHGHRPYLGLPLNTINAHLDER
ncbi:hypothetical protein TNCV_4517521 [Trichonephila clavipes]|nr:hypothetical protein TNCV_4517521 [Trichonephila clavipes]